MIKHFTSTVFVVHNQKIALHWHKKVSEWLPAGGHIDKNETPVEAGIREVNEEMGIEVKIISNSNYNFDEIETVPVEVATAELGARAQYKIVPFDTFVVDTEIVPDDPSEIVLGAVTL